MTSVLDNPVSILLLDDSADLLEIYENQIRAAGPFHVTSLTDSREALDYARRQLFDIIVLDAKLDYKGFELGGLRLADDLRPRYGKHAIIIISQYITSEQISLNGGDYVLVEKFRGARAKHFVPRLCDQIRKLLGRQYVFVAMSYNRDYESIYKFDIEPAVKTTGFRCVRADQAVHAKSLHDAMFEMIRNSKIVLFLADGKSPNAYYEVGFADSMKKEVVIVARTLEELEFNVSDRNTITYEDKGTSLPAQIGTKLRDLRLSHPVGFGEE